MRKAEWFSLKCKEELDGFCTEGSYYFVYKITESNYVFEDSGGNMSIITKNELDYYFEV